MYCDELIRELVVPTDDRDSAAVAEHLANCPSCAAWVSRDAQFDRLWDATRPVDPSALVWDTMWAQISSSLDSSTPSDFEAIASPVVSLNGSVSHIEPSLVSTSTSFRSRRRNWAAIGLIGLAQAAAVLLAVGWAWHNSSNSLETPVALAGHSSALPENSSKVVTESGLLSVPPVEIEAGRLVVIRMTNSTAEVVDLTPDGTSFSVDAWFLVFNAVEDIAKPVVAMKE